MKLNLSVKVILLIGCLATTCKAQSTQRTTTDSLRQLLPKGYYVLTEQGAKDALKAKMEADFLKKQVLIRDSVIALKDTIISYQKVEIAERVNVDILQQQALNKSKTKAVLKTIEIWAYRAVIVLKIVGLW
ncbi:hypothetical protein [Cellulophaga sp. BC115SP]|uniref:hypothetical protein n=1 Tax=Cellulophaga sp. BC115SP TaxID=2683263 RepID=UPI0014134B61|nr:hypothetical protein [Cellulophaga sp. BC115SP]NBB26775.1 hypothetical protein [Cellulophaga sp. BC115SP]